MLYRHMNKSSRRLAKRVIRVAATLMPRILCRGAAIGFVPGVRNLGVDFSCLGDVLLGARQVKSSWVAVRSLPQCLGREIPSAFLGEARHELPSAAAAIVPNGRILGTQGIVFDSEGYLIADPSKRISSSPYDWPALYQFTRPTPERIPGRWGVLTGCGSEGYFHWMMDVLPRIPLIREVAGSVDGWIVSDHSQPFILESLRLAGLGEDRIHLIGHNQQLIADEIVISSNPSVSGNPPRWSIDFLRSCSSRVANELQGSRPVRILLSRAGARGRRIVNEEALLNAVSPLGFVPVAPESLRLSEQIALFRQAHAVIAPHGAGLVNLAFCNPGTRVLEIFSPRYINVCFWALAECAALSYACVVGQGAGQTTHDATTADIRLETSDVAAITKWAHQLDA